MRRERSAGLLVTLAALAHGGLTPTHFGEWWGYGAFFLVVAVAQAILGLALLTDAFDDPRDQRLMYLAGAIGNALVVAMYVVSRTIGIPIFGPQAGEIEEIDPLGIATLVVELAVIALLWTSFTRARGRSAAADPLPR